MAKPKNKRRAYVETKHGINVINPGGTGTTGRTTVNLLGKPPTYAGNAYAKLLRQAKEYGIDLRGLGAPGGTQATATTRAGQRYLQRMYSQIKSGSAFKKRVAAPAMGTPPVPAPESVNSVNSLPTPRVRKPKKMTRRVKRR